MNTSENNYYAETFFTIKIVQDIMKEFEWTQDYKLIDTSESNISIVIQFKNCEIELSDDGEGAVDVEFLTYANGKELGVETAELVEFIDNYNPINDLEYATSGFPNLEDTKKAVRNVFKIIQMYYMPIIQGDYSIIEAYIADSEIQE